MIRKMRTFLIAALGVVSAEAVTTYTVSNTNASAEVAGSLPYALAQVDSKTTGEYCIKFAPAVYGQKIPWSTGTAFIGTRVAIDGTGSGVTLVPSGTSGAFMLMSSAGASLTVSNVTVSAATTPFVLNHRFAYAQVEIVGCRFENCKLSTNALLVQTTGGSFLHVERTTFSDNAVTGTDIDGSCAHVSNGRLRLDACSFVGNRATGDGGAVYSSTTGNVVVADCSFAQNAAGANGGGGAVYIEDGCTSTDHIVFERTSFFQNSAKGQAADEGGAVYVGGGRVVFAGTSFRGNSGHVAALKVRPGANVTLVNTTVADSVCQSADDDTTGRAIELADTNTVSFTAINSVIGGYTTDARREMGYCQLWRGPETKVNFFNTLVSEKNQCPYGMTTPFFECTEEDLASVLLGANANTVVNGVRIYGSAPCDGSALYGAGVVVRHSADWKTIVVSYGAKFQVLSGSLRTSTSEFAADLFGNDWSSVLSQPAYQRTIGAVWAPTQAKAQTMIPNYQGVQDPDDADGYRILVSGDYSNYLPPIIFNKPVTSAALGPNVTAFNPIWARGATALRNYVLRSTNASFKTVDGALYSADGSTLVAVPPACAAQFLVAPGVTTIGSNAFAAVRASNLSDGHLIVQLPDTVTTIEEGAFAGADDTAVYLRGMTAPTCSAFAFTNATDVTVYVPYRSTGWDGTATSTVLPETWHGAKIAYWEPTEYPSLEVTSLSDVEDPTDGRITLREAIGYANTYGTLSASGRAEVTFAANLSVDAETGKMQITLTAGEIRLSSEGYLTERPLVVSAPAERPLLVNGASNEDHARFLALEWQTKAELRNIEICDFGSLDGRTGGAVDLDEHCSLVVTNCHFRHNLASTNSWDGGGALYVGGGSDVRIFDSCFTGNKSEFGSAVYVGTSESDEDSFVLFERTSFTGNTTTAQPEDGDSTEEGGAVRIGALARVVFNHCSFIRNTGHVSDLFLREGADVTLVNTSVSDSCAHGEATDQNGSAIELCALNEDADLVPRLYAVNCVFGGNRNKTNRKRGYCALRSGLDAEIMLRNSIVSENRHLMQEGCSLSGDDGNGFLSTQAVWYYSEDAFTNYVYDVTTNFCGEAFATSYEPSPLAAPKMLRPLGTNSVLYGTGVCVLHDADWRNIAWRYGDEATQALRTDDAGLTATILVDRDILGNAYGASDARRRSIGPLRAWRPDGSHAVASDVLPDYALEPDADDEGVGMIFPPWNVKFLPPICGGRSVAKVGIKAGIENVDPAWCVSAPAFGSYVAVDSAIYTSMGGLLYTETADGLTLVAAPPGRMTQPVQNGTRVIGANAFRYTADTTTINLPSSVSHLGAGAFANPLFAENGISIYAYTMNAPTYDATSFAGLVASNGSIYVPTGSKGWDGNPNSTALPTPDAIWPTDTALGCLSIDHEEMAEYHTLHVTTCADVVNDADGVTSLREALNAVAEAETALFDNGVATVTFDPSLADAHGVLNLAFDEEQGPFVLQASETFAHSLVLAAPAGCCVRLCSNAEPNSDTNCGAFEVGDVYGQLTLAGFDVEGFCDNEAAALCSDWDQSYIRTVVISNCTFRRCSNTGTRGGAVSLAAVNVTIVDSVFTDNEQSADGGGRGGALCLRVGGADGERGLAVIDRCAFSGNRAWAGGGFAIEGYEAADRAVVVNTTVSGNEVTAYGAGALVSFVDATFVNTTIRDNLSARETDKPVTGVQRESDAKLELVNCVLASSAYYTVDEDSKYIGYDVVFGTDDESASVRAVNCVFGRISKGEDVAATDYVACEIAEAASTWLGAATTATNVLTQLALPCHLPSAGGSAAQKGLPVYYNADWSSIVCGSGNNAICVRGSSAGLALLDRDMLGYTRSETYNAVGAVAADPAVRPVSGYAAWAAAQGLTGADAAPDAKPAKWGGAWANAFVYTYGEGIVDGTDVLLSIRLDDAGEPILTTLPVVEGHDDFTAEVVGSKSLTDWTKAIRLDRTGNDWTLPAGSEAQFFRLRLHE